MFTQITHLSDAVEEDRGQIRNVTEDRCFTAERTQKLEYEIEHSVDETTSDFSTFTSRQKRLMMTAQGHLYEPSTNVIPQNGGVKMT